MSLVYPDAVLIGLSVNNVEAIVDVTNDGNVILLSRTND